jgi:hypothetical protein
MKRRRFFEVFFEARGTHYYSFSFSLKNICRKEYTYYIPERCAPKGTRMRPKRYADAPQKVRGAYLLKN